MSPIISALNAGYSASRILNYIQRIDPQLAMHINTALQAGHSIESVLKFLDKNGKHISSLFQSKEQEKPYQNIYKHAQESIHPALKGAAEFGGGLAAAGLGAYALSRALPQAAQALQGELLPGLPRGAAQIGMQQAPQQIAQQQQQLPFIQGQATPIRPPQPPASAQQPPISPPQAASMPQAAPIPQMTPLPKALHQQAIALLEAENSPEQIENILKALQPKIVKEYEKETNIPIRQAIDEFAKTLPAKESKTESTLQPTIQQPKVNAVSAPVEKEQPESKIGKMVSFPDGTIGNITEIRKNIATVNAEGKERRRKLDDLIESPLPEKELADLYDDLILGIEKEIGQEVSRAINYMGFNPEKKSLVVHYAAPGADTYVFNNLDEKRIEELLKLEQLRRTTNENYIGGWKEGTKSILGSKMYDLVKELEKERGGKGKAHEFTYKTLYDAIEPAKLASHHKFKEKEKAKSAEKKAEKERIKKEKENVKKRKTKKPRPS